MMQAPRGVVVEQLGHEDDDHELSGAVVCDGAGRKHRRAAATVLGLLPFKLRVIVIGCAVLAAYVLLFALGNLYAACMAALDDRADAYTNSAQCMLQAQPRSDRIVDCAAVRRILESPLGWVGRAAELERRAVAAHVRYLIDTVGMILAGHWFRDALIAAEE